MSRFTHAMCTVCWVQARGDRVPHQVLGSPPHRCCFCGERTDAGIFIRRDPAGLRCDGRHPEDAAEQMTLHHSVVRLRWAEGQLAVWEQRVARAALRVRHWQARVERYRNRARTFAPEQLKADE